MGWDYLATQEVAYKTIVGKDIKLKQGRNIIFLNRKLRYSIPFKKKHKNIYPSNSHLWEETETLFAKKIPKLIHPPLPRWFVVSWWWRRTCPPLRWFQGRNLASQGTITYPTRGKGRWTPKRRATWEVKLRSNPVKVEIFAVENWQNMCQTYLRVELLSFSSEPLSHGY